MDNTQRLVSGHWGLVLVRDDYLLGSGEWGDASFTPVTVLATGILEESCR